MRKKIIAGLLAMALYTTPAQATEYLLGPGDVLNINVLGINVWGDNTADTNKSAITVRPDGKFSFPLVGELEVTGQTPAQLTAVLTEGLSRYVRDPIVTLNVVKFRTVRVYVLGEVTKPGVYELDRDHTIMDAIGHAGAFTTYAAKRKITVIPYNNAMQKHNVNLMKLFKEGDLTQNVVLNEGDVVYVSSSGKLDFSRDVLPWISATYQVKRWDK